MRLLVTIALALLLAGCGPSAETHALVSQVHVISIHVKDPATFDAVFLLFRDTLRLPPLYGEPCVPDSGGRTLYAGFSVGNAYLEPCGPYKNDAPFGPDRPARFHGLAFACAEPIAGAAKELGRRDIRHTGLFGGGPYRFVYVTDGLLNSPTQAVGLWEILDPNEHTNLDFVASSLRRAGGGALGIRRIAEVRMRYPAKENLTQWARFMAPSKRKGDVWRAGNGPALRLTKGPELEIESILLDVESLDKAAAALSRAGIPTTQSAGTLSLDPSKVFGLQIRLQQARKGRR
jgi:hypothetical protein